MNCKRKFKRSSALTAFEAKLPKSPLTSRFEFRLHLCKPRLLLIVSHIFVAPVIMYQRRGCLQHGCPLGDQGQKCARGFRFWRRASKKKHFQSELWRHNKTKALLRHPGSSRWKTPLRRKKKRICWRFATRCRLKRPRRGWTAEVFEARAQKPQQFRLFCWSFSGELSLNCEGSSAAQLLTRGQAEVIGRENCSDGKNNLISVRRWLFCL